ncbi:hypothetical protein FMUND_12373 [Fusarium mundagurra]|uniref:Uncharacterized protein n=1 Tax=Fusarium mundagurra TaxID=1567541 RepID=A0A8H6D5T9_9HYPO|nr:hypothetical protein FMUND_12373 [Fusarium mundagurra]
MAAAVDVKSDGSVRDLSKGPLLDLESDLGWLCLNDRNNLSDDRMGIESPPDGQHVTSNESVQPLDSGPQSVMEADASDSDDKLQKLCTMLRRHEPAFLKFSQESPQILVNSVSAAKDLIQLTILVNKTNEEMAAKAKRQAEHDKNVMLILKNVDRAYQDIHTRIGTMQQRLDETVAENCTKINASTQECLNVTVAEMSAKFDASMQERFNETVAELFTKFDASMQNGAELYEQAVLSAFQESDIFETVIKKAVAKLQPRIVHPVDNGNNALDEDIQ